ncbi:TolC family protein [Sediminitomix flava]|uniref:Outer membrane protein TolC n=1 Tax=Sediminitomix flava TaxID=379075 RepID=A0A315Z5M8_SEDFL|nr:TolC family protein [Sediminitomix flava]PWJ38446.1 outer membrane protein TolC [Sediminitomix flava]
MRYLYTIYFCFLGFSVFGQNVLSLKEAIEIAQSNSLQGKEFTATQEAAEWEFKSFRASFLPQLSLEASPASYSNTFNPITQPDGGVEYQSIEQNNGSIQLNLSQEIVSTGGQLYVGSQLVRFDDFLQSQHQYNAQPFFIGYSQPILKYNELKWQRKLQPLQLEEAQKGYSEDMEWLGLQTTNLFFVALKAQIQSKIAQNNLSDNQKILKITEEKLALGRASKNDLLQVKLNVLNAGKQFSDAELNNMMALRALCDFLNLDPEDRSLSLQLPQILDLKEVSADLAWKKAQTNRKDFVTYHKKMIEAESEVARVKRNNRFQADLNVAIGFNNQANSLDQTYSNTVQSQQVNLSLSMPIVDWGKGKGVIKAAQLKRKRIEANVERDKMTFERDVINTVQQLSNASIQVDRNMEAQEIASEKYEIALSKFSLGELSMRELVWNTSEKDAAQNEYILALESYWLSFYQLRTLTLFDFETQQDIHY